MRLKIELIAFLNIIDGHRTLFSDVTTVRFLNRTELIIRNIRH